MGNTAQRFAAEVPNPNSESFREQGYQAPKKLQIPSSKVIAIDGQTILADDVADAPGIVQTIERGNSGRLKELLNKLVERSQIAMVISALNQKKINAATRHLETKVAEGLGEWVCRIDRLQFLAQQRVHGWNCWSDPEFIEAFLRDNPEYRLRYHAKNYVAGWRPNDECRIEPAGSCARWPEPDRASAGQREAMTNDEGSSKSEVRNGRRPENLTADGADNTDGEPKTSVLSEQSAISAVNSLVSV